MKVENTKMNKEKYRTVNRDTDTEAFMLTIERTPFEKGSPLTEARPFVTA